MTQKPETQKLVYSPAEAAKLLGVSVITLQRMRSRGNGPKWKRIGSHKIAYTHEAILSYLNAA